MEVNDPSKEAKRTRSVCALLELVGLRALAAEDPVDYVRVMRNIKAKIQGIFANNSDTEIALLLDKIFLQDDSVIRLVDLIRELRRELLAATVGMVMRGVLLCGKSSFEKLSSKRSEGEWREEKTYGYVSDEATSKACGQLELLKGVGICIDKEVEDLISHSNGTTIKNWFIVNSNRRRFTEFTDLAFTSGELTGSGLTILINSLDAARHRSRKLARYYIPILVNWARLMEIHTRFADKPFAEKPIDEWPLDVRLSRGKLNDMREVPGHEILFLAVYERFFFPKLDLDSNQSRPNPRRRYWLVDFLKKSRWMQQILRKDDYPVDIPAGVIHDSTRQELIKLLSKPIGDEPRDSDE